MNHRPRKRFGQHFLHDANIIRRIVDAVAPREGELLVEIGPGEAALTEPLRLSGARLAVLEVDRDLVASLRERYAACGVRVIEGDALDVDLRALRDELDGDGARLRVVGNLPYNISTPLIFHLFEYLPVVADIHVMVQKEVADRLAAGAGSGSYGRLSVMVAADATVEHLFDVAPGCFRPPPKVRSAVVRIRPRAQSLVSKSCRVVFEEVVRQCFSQRRKTLRRSLSRWLSSDQIESCGIAPEERPERLPVSHFVTLAEAILALR